MWDYKCSECGSDFITWDASASWNVQKQDFDLESTYDHCECGECGGTSIDDIELKPIQNYGPPYSMANPTGEPIKDSPLGAGFVHKDTKKGIQNDPEC